MANKKQNRRGPGFTYKRRYYLGYYTYAKKYIKCLYDYGKARFFGEMGCAWYTDQNLYVNHTKDHLWTDCWCIFSNNDDIWDSYPSK